MSSKPSSRCLIMLTDSRLQKRVSSFSNTQNHTQTTINPHSFNHTSSSSSSFNLQFLNSSRNNSKQYLFRDSITKESKRKTDNLKDKLKQKQDMSEFYRKQLMRRRNRFQEEMYGRERVLNETIKNLMSLIKIEVDKNKGLEEQIEKYEGMGKETGRGSEGKRRREGRGKTQESEMEYQITESRHSGGHDDTMLLQEASIGFNRYY